MFIIVTTCKENHGFLENNVLNMNSIKLFNEIKMKKAGKLKNYKSSLKLKENVTPSYYETRKLQVHLLPFVVAKPLKESLVIAWTTTRARQFLIGKKNSFEK